MLITDDLLAGLVGKGGAFESLLYSLFSAGAPASVRLTPRRKGSTGAR